MTRRLLPVVIALLLLPSVAAAAESEACASTCEDYRFCAGGALQAIYDGVFSGSGCSDYESCDQVVQLCRAAAGTCEPQCEDFVDN